MSITFAPTRTPALPATPVVSVAAVGSPLSVRPAELSAAVADGAAVVDLRGAPARRAQGAFPGALAVDLDEALEVLRPGGTAALRSATDDARWVLVTDDGHDAEWVAWHLQARGVAGARYLLGGHRGLRAAGLLPVYLADGHEYFG